MGVALLDALAPSDNRLACCSRPLFNESMSARANPSQRPTVPMNSCTRAWQAASSRPPPRRPRSPRTRASEPTTPASRDRAQRPRSRRAWPARSPRSQRQQSLPSTKDGGSFVPAPPPPPRRKSTRLSAPISLAKNLVHASTLAQTDATERGSVRAPAVRSSRAGRHARAQSASLSRFGGKATILPVLRSPSDDVSTFRGESVRGRDYDVG
jgi:hypothetical protein